MFCCAIFFTFLPFYALAADESLSERRQLCDISVLEKAISDYLQITDEGGWPQIPAGPALREGDRNDRVSFLRKRLIVSGDLELAHKPNQIEAVNGNLIENLPVSQTHRDPTVNGFASNQNGSPPLTKKKLAAKNDPAELVNQDNVFDEMLKEAVQRFQKRHGLTVNGIVGAETLKELNVPVRERIRQLSATIERCRKLPPLQENRYILINITDFTLNLFEDGKPVLSMPVIVGKTTQQTPEFDGLITNLIINPAWSVPFSIAAKEYLPKLKKNPGYLSRSRMQVYRSNQRIDPSTINWSSYSERNFPLLLRQDPGPGNSLGRIKFMFTNPHDIYLHDTTTKKLFQRFPRAFSHGCIRVKDPIDLAVYLMQETPMGSEEAIKSAINKGKTQSLNLPSPIPINIVYVTAWVDSEGTVQFRPNIYNRKISSEEEIIADTTAPSKTPSAGTASEQPKAMIKTTRAATGRVPETAASVAHSKPVVKTPATAQSTVQATTPAKATPTATPVAQAKPAAKTPVTAQPTVQATAPVKATPTATPVIQAKPAAKIPVTAQPTVQATAPVKATPTATPVTQAKPAAKTPVTAQPTVQAAAPVKTSSVSRTPEQKVKVIGNRDSKRYHLPGMKYYNAVEAYHRVEFDSEEDAIKAGYHKARR